MVIVQPADRRFIVLQPDGFAVLLRPVLALLGRGVIVPAHIAGSYDQNVAWAWSCSLPFEAGFDLGYRNLVARDCRGWVTVFLLVLCDTRLVTLMLNVRLSPRYPAKPVDQNTSSDDASSFTPVMNAIPGRLRGFVVREAIVIHSRFLVREVLQTVPLRTGLSIDIDLIVQSSESQGSEIT